MSAPTGSCARNLPQHFNGCTCTPAPGQGTAEATEVTLTAPATPQDPATQARYKVVEDSLTILERDVCDPLEEEFGDEEAPDTFTLRDYIDNGWYAFDNADGTVEAMHAFADHLDAGENHVWNTTNDAPGGGYDEMNGRRAAAREDYWDAKGHSSVKSLKEIAASIRATAHQHEDADFTGSGWGTHRPTEVVTDLTQIRVGDVLVEQSERFGSRNLFLVTSNNTERGIMLGYFVDPTDPSRKRMTSDQGQSVWDFQVTKGEMSFTDIRGPEQPAAQPDTETS